MLKEGPALKSELAAYDAEKAVDKLRLELDSTRQSVALADLERQISGLLLKRKNEKIAEDAVVKAQDELEQVSFNVNKPLAERNLELAILNRNITKVKDGVEEDRNVAQKKLKDLKAEFELTKQKVEKVGLNAAVGALLRRQRTSLPDVRVHRDAVQGLQPRIDDAQLLLLDLEEEKKQLDDAESNDFEALASQYFDFELTEDLTREEREAARLEANGLWKRRRADYLVQLIRSQESYFNALTDLSISHGELILKSEEFAEYIDERVLWVRSEQSFLEMLKPRVAEPLANGVAVVPQAEPSESPAAPGTAARPTKSAAAPPAAPSNESPLSQTMEELKDSIAWLLRPRNWNAVGKGLWADAGNSPIRWILFVAAFLAIVRFAVRLRRRINEVGEQVRRSSFSHFRPTMHAAVLTAFIALPWPAMMVFIGVRLGSAANGNDFILGLASGIYHLAGGYLFLDLIRQLCRPHGLAEAHFQWPESSVRLLRRYTRLLMLFGLPLVLVVATLHAGDPGSQGRNSLERLFFISLTVLLSIVSARVLSPRHGVFHYYLALHSEGWVSRLRYAWYAIAVASPLSLGYLAFVGYNYTAQQLAWRAYISAAFVAALVVANGFLQRLLMVHRRRLSMEQARQRRAAALAAAEAEAAAEQIVAAADVPAVEETAADLAVQTSQTCRLVVTGLLGAAFIGFWLIWVDVLPALEFLERWPLWTTTIQETTTQTLKDTGDLQITTTDKLNPVTIADLILAIFIAVVTLTAARNLPGLLEISLLQRLPLEGSIRYAITTLCSYAILLVGLIATCNVVGLRWSQIQWMATALTFGLAFGLQEMFANFVAGIIILFERPIRVGDIVTVDDISGVVSRVRIRATTITNWDRKDFVVPNKDFITGRVLNWTLSDQVSRIVIEVGVAYGSDTAAAKRLLLEIAQEHSQVVDEPRPTATFEAFGESSLTIVLRCFISMRDMASRLQIIDDLHSSIDEAFRKADIEIAFPQRDLHIRSFTPTVGVESHNGVPSDSLKLGKP